MDTKNGTPTPTRGRETSKGRRTTVALYDDVYKRLLDRLRPRESMNDVIRRLLDSEDGCCTPGGKEGSL